MRCKPFPRRGQLSHLARGFRVYTLGLVDASGREWQEWLATSEPAPPQAAHIHAVSAAARPPLLRCEPQVSSA